MKRSQAIKLSLIVPAQIRAARAMLGWTQEELAARSGISKRSILSLEIEETIPKEETKTRVVRSLEAAGIEFRRTSDYRPSVALGSPPDSAGLQTVRDVKE
ncbi:helix-turn-helix transcriptional regulator [Methylobacterium sp. CM6246]